MPLQTFFNLSHKRQEEIRKAAYEEFALHEYKVASISNMVKKLNMAKGSFYQYFENKKDLYFYLIDHASNMRLNEIGDLFSNTELDFFDLITENFALKIHFDLKNPLVSGFLYNVMQEKNNEEIGNIQIQTKKQVISIVLDIIKPHIEKGRIKSGIPPFDMAFLIMQIQWGMYDYLQIKYNLDFRENVKMGNPVFSIPEEQILQDVSSFTQILRKGIQKKQK